MFANTKYFKHVVRLQWTQYSTTYSSRSLLCECPLFYGHMSHEWELYSAFYWDATSCSKCALPHAEWKLFSWTQGVALKCYYRPKRSFGQGYIFTDVCHSVNMGGGGLQFFGGVSNFSGGGGGLQFFWGGGLQFFRGGLWNTVNIRPVHILLECILVTKFGFWAQYTITYCLRSLLCESPLSYGQKWQHASFMRITFSILFGYHLLFKMWLISWRMKNLFLF